MSEAILKRIIEKNSSLKVEPANKDPKVITDKDIYVHGEKILVKYYNAPGLKEDWISIVPINSPDNIDDEHKHMTEDKQGVMDFYNLDYLSPRGLRSQSLL